MSILLHAFAGAVATIVACTGLGLPLVRGYAEHRDRSEVLLWALAIGATLISFLGVVVQYRRGVAYAIAALGLALLIRYWPAEVPVVHISWLAVLVLLVYAFFLAGSSLAPGPEFSPSPSLRFAWLIGGTPAQPLTACLFLLALVILVFLTARRESGVVSAYFAAGLLLGSPLIRVAGTVSHAAAIQTFLLFAGVSLLRRRAFLMGAFALLSAFPLASGRVDAVPGLIFLLSPLALFAIPRAGAWLWAVAGSIAALPAILLRDLGLMTTALPFAALLMGIAFADFPVLVGLLLVFHLALGWPARFSHWKDVVFPERGVRTVHARLVQLP